MHHFEIFGVFVKVGGKSGKTPAWAVCASVHQEYGKGRDPFFKTRAADFTRSEKNARATYAARDALREDDSVA